MENFEANFYIAEYETGEEVPAIRIQNSKYAMLANLSQGHLSESIGVEQEIRKILEVINKEIDSHSFGGDDWCILDVKRKRTMIINGFDEFDPIEVSTEKILKLMTNWLDFLKSHNR